MGFSTFRETNNRSGGYGGAKKPSKDDSDMDSDDDDIGKSKSVKQEDADTQESGISALSPDDAKRQRELADGVQKIRVTTILFFHHPLLLALHKDSRL